MMFKRTALKVLKTVAAIAAVVAFFVPFGPFNQMMIFVGSLALLLVCLIASSALEDEPTGYWPSKNIK